MLRLDPVLTSVEGSRSYLHTIRRQHLPFTATGPSHNLHHDQDNRTYEEWNLRSVSMLSVQSPCS